MSKKVKSTGVTITPTAKAGGKSESWVVRDNKTGRFHTVSVSKSSAKHIDEIVKRHAGTMKRLADR